MGAGASKSWDKCGRRTSSPPAYNHGVYADGLDVRYGDIYSTSEWSGVEWMYGIACTICRYIMALSVVALHLRVENGDKTWCGAQVKVIRRSNLCICRLTRCMMCRYRMAQHTATND